MKKRINPFKDPSSSCLMRYPFTWARHMTGIILRRNEAISKTYTCRIRTTGYPLKIHSATYVMHDLG